MRRGGRLLAVFVALAVFSLAYPQLTAASDEIRVILDGRQLSFPVPPAAEQGTILVPVRAIFGALGATVTFDSGVITATKGDRVVQLTLGSTIAKVGQETKQLQVAAKAVNGSTLVPLR